MRHIFSILALSLVLIACHTKEVDRITSKNVSDKEATSSLEEYYSVLVKRMNQGIMLGHQDALAYGSMWYGEIGRSDVKSVCGDYPAVVGWDLGKVEKKAILNVDSVSFANIKKYVLDMYQMNGVSTFNWSVDSPIQDSTATSGSIASVLPGNPNHNIYIGYLDELANFFLELKNEKGDYIPVIFRPFNDPETTSHWWNTRENSVEDYRSLWCMTVDYLRNTKKIHHVLYAYSLYSPESASDFADFYPGDTYVDIIGVNLYLDLEQDMDGTQYKKNLNRSLQSASDFAEKHNKITALTETGLKGVKLSNFFSSIVSPVISKYKISYILFGRNAWNIEDYYHIPIPGHPASEDFDVFASNPKILTRTKLEVKS